MLRKEVRFEISRRFVIDERRLFSYLSYIYGKLIELKKKRRITRKNRTILLSENDINIENLVKFAKFFIHLLEIKRRI